jgi:nitrogen fixation/metabolism regulation signal transduction histidine kinase
MVNKKNEKNGKEYMSLENKKQIEEKLWQYADIVLYILVMAIAVALLISASVVILPVILLIVAISYGIDYYNEK